MRQATLLMILIALLLIVVIGCASQQILTARMQTRVGAPEDKLITTLGIPEAQYELPDGKKMITYRYGGASTSVYYGSGVSQTVASQCAISFVIKAQIVVDFSLRGNACVAQIDPSKELIYLTYIGIVPRSEVNEVTHNRKIVAWYVKPFFPADISGIVASDEIVTIDSTPIVELADIPKAIRKHAAGDAINIVVNRNGTLLEKAVRPISLEIETLARPSSSSTTQPCTTGDWRC